MGVVLGSDGWRLFSSSHDTRIIYVSSSVGNDANTGFASNAPKKTITAAALLMRSGYPDWMLLKKGDTFTATDYPILNGRSAAEPALISYYDIGALPVVETAGLREYFIIKAGFGQSVQATWSETIVNAPPPLPPPPPPPSPTTVYTWRSYKSGKSTIYRIFEGATERCNGLSLIECRWLCSVLKIVGP